MKNYSIAFYDSGVGGLSVLSECKKMLPYENFIYLGDNENLPYGNKSVSTLFSIAKKNICILESYGVKVIEFEYDAPIENTYKNL
jgi:glutamate racemase